MITDKNGRSLSSAEVVGKVGNRFKNIGIELVVYILHLAGNIPSHVIRNIFYTLAGIRIGKGSTLHMGAVFYEPFRITIGNDTIIGEKVVLDGRAQLTIGNHVDIASEVMIYNSHHDINDGNFTAVTAPVVIEDYVFVGPRAIILPGVTIGMGAVIAAGAVVTKSVAPFSIVGGVPAQVIGERKNKELNYVLGRARWFR